MASTSEVAASEDASASIAFEDDFMVRGWRALFAGYQLLYVSKKKTLIGQIIYS